jgi:hypothetical protein
MTDVSKILRELDDDSLKLLEKLINNVDYFDVEDEKKRRKLGKQKYKIKSVYLLRLADKLEGKGAYSDAGPVPKVLFNMDAWIGEKLPEEQVSKKLKAWLEANVDSGVEACGTAACACGWAASDPFFRMRGLGLRNIRGYAIDNPIFELAYEGADGYDAAAQFFHIQYDHAEFLFGPEEYADGVGPHKVAKRIRQFVEDVEAGKITKGSVYADKKWVY